jgi:hypothetical protein
MSRRRQELPRDIVIYGSETIFRPSNDARDAWPSHLALSPGTAKSGCSARILQPTLNNCNNVHGYVALVPHNLIPRVF